MIIIKDLILIILIKIFFLFNLINIENNFIKNNNYINNNNNLSKNNINKERSKQFHLLDKKNIYGSRPNNMRKSAPIPLAIKDITSNSIRDNNTKYFHKFTDYYLNQNRNNANNNNNINYQRYINNSVKDNYYNYINDENRYIRNIYNTQKEKEDKLNMSVNQLNDRIKNNAYRTPIRNKNDYDIYYRKNRTFATVFDSMENNKTQENDFIKYKNFQKENEYID